MANSRIERAIALAEQGIGSVQRAISILRQIGAVLPEDTGASVWQVRGKAEINLHPREGEGYELAQLLAGALGYVFRREISESGGTLHYRAMVDGIEICIYGHHDPTCEIVCTVERVEVPRYQLRCPNAVEEVA